MPNFLSAFVYKDYQKIVILAFSSLLVNGCATLSREECLYASWYELGIKDGRVGKPRDLLGYHQEACAEYGVKVNESEYLAGRQQGLVSYCKLTNAFDTGLRGNRYQGVCPREIDIIFNRYNEAAYQVYQQREKLKSLDSSLSDKESSLLNTKLSDEKKAYLHKEIKQLNRDHYRQRDELYILERRLDQLIDENRVHRLQNFN